MKDSISVIICAFNEEGSIATAIKQVETTVKKEVSDYEIIVVNDGSLDQTGGIAEKIAWSNGKIKIISHHKNLGFGMAFRTGIFAASKNYIAGYPSDCDLLPADFKAIISKRKQADIISSYLTNMGDRTLMRKLYSEFFTGFINLLFGLKLKYFNGYFITRADKLKFLKLKSQGFTLFAEIKIKLMRNGATILEVPILFSPRTSGKSKALSYKSLTQAIRIIPVLLKDVYFS